MTRNPHALAASGLVLAAAAAAASAALAAGPKLETAIFAGGCFWTEEHKLEGAPGVVDVQSGYTGGRTTHPSYKDVNTETTGHLEAVKVTYDPAKTSYKALLDRYWRTIDPTQADGQVCDIAPSYHSAIFAMTPEQKRVALASKAELNGTRFNGKVVTEVRDAVPFWPAEAYHQDYARRNPAQYGLYALGCGRDRRLKAVWGDR